MNREILFRGKRLDNGKWVYGNLITSDDATKGFETIIIPKNNSSMYTNYCCELGFEVWHKVKQDTVCQYTGLMDDYGNKFYEGDICDFKTFDDNGHSTQWRGFIVYSGSRFMLWTSKDCDVFAFKNTFDFDSIHETDGEMKIIGNIFDNPELIKGSDDV
jgi:uncharacterized phage protein (TIGR01671 family)